MPEGGQPEGVVFQKQDFPAVEHGGRNLRDFAQFGYGFAAGEIAPQHTQYKQQTVLAVWDDEIREDGVGMAAAGADQPLNRNPVILRFPALVEIYDISLIC